MNKKSHPYSELPPKAFWRRSVAGIVPEDIDPVGIFEIRLTPDTKVATAGSCFAQHIARHLSAVGFNYYIAEQGHPILSDAVKRQNNYGVFSARYGNIYTARQLAQLFRRAYGRFIPLEDAWIDEGRVVRDPFRPTVQPEGFISSEEMQTDRAQHLEAVRNMFETLDVFVFTLGLTECWVSLEDGAVFPLCPGVEGGNFDKNKYSFYNQSVDDVLADMTEFIQNLASVNRKAQIILTVSPVPLAATAVPDGHVLSSTTYSKSVLRVAAEILTQRFPSVHYFPSYEIITGAFSRGAYYGENLRDVTEAGVSHVMKLFLKHATGAALPVDGSEKKDEVVSEVKTETDFLKLAEQIVQVECDEMLLDRPNP